MRRLVALIACTLILVLSPAGLSTEFNTDGDTEGWIPNPAIADLTAKDGALIATIAANANDPFIGLPSTEPWDANDITGVLARMRWSADGSSAGGKQFFWFHPGHTSKGYEVSDSNDWQIVFVDLLGEAEWTGSVNRIRFDLADGIAEDRTVEFDWIRLENLYLTNETFEWGGLLGWDVIGNPVDFNDQQWETVNSLSYSVECTGTGEYHALSQPIKGGLERDAGYVVTVHAAVNIPADSWDANSSLWFRVREFNGTDERLSPPIEVTVFDEWFQCSGSLELAYAPSERTALEVQLYSKLPSGKVFYFDDVFVSWDEPVIDVRDDHWRHVNSHWEFNTPHDTEGWPIPNPERITYFDVNDGSLLIDLPAGTFDPYFFSPGGPYYAENIEGVAVRMKWSGDAADQQKAQHAVYWFPVEGGHGSRGWNVPAIDEWFVAYVNTGAFWEGWINNFRFDFGHYDGLVLVDIDWIRLYGEYIKNNAFAGSLDPWVHQGAGDIGAFSMATDQKVSGETSLGIEGLGSDQYHAVAQTVEEWDRIPKGAAITLRGAYFVPADSWDGDSVLWLRIKEYDGNVENLTAALTSPELDAWTPFEYTLQTVYEPEERTTVQVQLFSKTPAGKMIYVDDVFLTVMASEQAPEQEFTWPVNSVRLAEGQQITIDGQVSADEYAGAQAMVLNAETRTGPDPYFEGITHAGQLHGQATDTSLDDFSATYYFMWDDTYFYAAVSAQDDNYSFAGPFPNSSDTLQFVFGQTTSEATAANMYIPTIAPDDGTGSPFAKNDFGGWITKDIMAQSEYAASVDPATQDWTVEVRIPWSAMQGDFAAEVFPPDVGDSVGFSVLAIDYDDAVLGWFAANGDFPWGGMGLQPLY
ncbi:MAG: sugar-binding protein, partial [Planctomycetota bacterium]